MRTILIAFLMKFATQACAVGGKRGDSLWWTSAINDDVRSELDVGADVMARGVYNKEKALHQAVEINGATDVKKINLALLGAGADVMIQNKDWKIPWD